MTTYSQQNVCTVGSGRKPKKNFEAKTRLAVSCFHFYLFKQGLTQTGQRNTAHIHVYIHVHSMNNEQRNGAEVALTCTENSSIFIVTAVMKTSGSVVAL